ncbi:hypothetical protein SAY87_027426 [Trapa incisa]|uniref:Uncharacterized protein n=1 Tax=Trapa incisa TaxID=236973 RepID=A0AAN7JLX8_9MYRT|nr:hypothetical protein SAY87_027426 [Trapa incisa]
MHGFKIRLYEPGSARLINYVVSHRNHLARHGGTEIVHIGLDGLKCLRANSVVLLEASWYTLGLAAPSPFLVPIHTREIFTVTGQIFLTGGLELKKNERKSVEEERG